MASYITAAVEWADCDHVQRRTSPSGFTLEHRYQPLDCLLCNGSGTRAVRWVALRLPDHTAVGKSMANRRLVEEEVRALNAQL